MKDISKICQMVMMAIAILRYRRPKIEADMLREHYAVLDVLICLSLGPAILNMTGDFRVCMANDKVGLSIWQF